jgi:hypothetical protein
MSGFVPAASIQVLQDMREEVDNALAFANQMRPTSMPYIIRLMPIKASLNNAIQATEEYLTFARNNEPKEES